MNNPTIRFHINLSTLPPIFIITFSLMLGIITGSWMLKCIDPFFGIILIATLIAILIFFTRQRFYLVVLFLIGIVRIFSHHYAYNQIPSQAFKGPCAITGTVALIATSGQKRFKQTISLQPISIQLKETTFFFPQTYGIFQIYTKGIKDMKEGDTVEFKNIQLKKIRNHSFKTYLIKEGVCTTVFLENPEYKIITRPSFSYLQTTSNLKNRLYSTLKTKLEPKTFALFSSLFLGNKTYKKHYLDTVSDNFKQWGISHFLARSGLHLVIFILIWELLFKLMPWRYSTKGYLLISLSALYYILSWPSISFIRAFLIFIFTRCCALNKHPSHFMHILLFTCCIALLINPLQLFFLDFQLSFFLTFGLSWISLYSNREQQANATVAFRKNYSLK